MIYKKIDKHIGIIICAVLSLSIILTNNAIANITKLPNNSMFDNTSSFSITKSNGILYMILSKNKQKNKPPFLYFTKSKDSGNHWADLKKLPVGTYVPNKLNRMRDPRLAVYGKKIMAVWSAAGKGPYGSGAVGTAISDNGGKTWHSGPAIGSIGSTVGHRFPAIAADNKGFYAVWLKSVNGNSNENIQYERSLKFARLNYGAKKWINKKIIDAYICTCCWNRLYVDSAGRLVAVYRNHDPRDISIATSSNHGKTWTKKIDVGSFGWHNEVCPMNGGSFADIASANSDESTQLVTAWTGAPGKIGAYVIKSNDSGKNWQKPKPLKIKGQSGVHSDVATLSSGKSVVVFDCLVNDKYQVFAITSTDGGNTWGQPKRLSSKEAEASYPYVIAVNGKFLAFWTKRKKEGKPSIAMSQITF